jgi:hypothetical protein
MRKLILSLPILFAFMLVMTGCGSKAVDPTPTELLTKTWNVSVAKHGNTQVYQKGGASNTVAGYIGYRLTLGAASAATLTAVDGTTFSGTWALGSSDKVITLSGLKSAAGQAPTGTTGTIVYNVLSAITATTVTLETASPDLKAGNTTVNLQLVNP